MKRLCCSCCHQEVDPKDEVILDLMNTITHKICEQTGFPIKDTDSFNNIIHKYDFFHELIIH